MGAPEATLTLEVVEQADIVNAQAPAKVKDTIFFTSKTIIITLTISTAFAVSHISFMRYQSVSVFSSLGVKLNEQV